MSKYPHYFTPIFLLFSICSCAQQSVPFNDPRISYEGRVAYTTDAATLMWPGTSVKINFEGTSIEGTFKDSDTANYYYAIVDGKLNPEKFHFGKEKQKYRLAKGLTSGKHSLELFKITEWDKGRTWFYGFSFDAKIKLLPPSAKPKRKIEFFGNSITCGYALEDTVTDSPAGYFENNYDAYAAITARHFDAQFHCTSKSGIGITVSWFPMIMPEMYDRLDPEDATSKWDFSKYTPDVVVINLLQNDSWIVDMPENEQFKRQFGTKAPDNSFIIKAYQKFVQTIRGKYPQSTIICMLGNMDITRKESPWPRYVEQAVAPLNDRKLFTLFAPYKETGGHPKKAEQQVLADQLIRFIEERVKW
jgi:lysophospholipase L1-like esterase